MTSSEAAAESQRPVTCVQQEIHQLWLTYSMCSESHKSPVMHIKPLWMPHCNLGYSFISGRGEWVTASADKLKLHGSIWRTWQTAVISVDYQHELCGLCVRFIVSLNASSGTWSQCWAGRGVLSKSLSLPHQWLSLLLQSAAFLLCLTVPMNCLAHSQGVCWSTSPGPPGNNLVHFAPSHS